MNHSFKTESLDDAIRQVIRTHASMQGRSTKSLAEALGLSERDLTDMLLGRQYLAWSRIHKLTELLDIHWTVTGETHNETTVGLDRTGRALPIRTSVDPPHEGLVEATPHISPSDGHSWQVRSRN